MRFLNYLNDVHTQSEYEKIIEKFNLEIEKQKSDLEIFSKKALARIDKLKSCGKNLEYVVLGGTRKSGNKKEILLIIRYPDGTQRYEGYLFNKIQDMRTKLEELKKKYPCKDWSNFRIEI